MREMSAKGLGAAAAVTEARDHVLGIFTDGDLRRSGGARARTYALMTVAADVMHASPMHHPGAGALAVGRG